MSHLPTQKKKSVFAQRWASLPSTQSGVLTERQDDPGTGLQMSLETFRNCQESPTSLALKLTSFRQSQTWESVSSDSEPDKWSGIGPGLGKGPLGLISSSEAWDPFKFGNSFGANTPSSPLLLLTFLVLVHTVVEMLGPPCCRFWPWT